MVIYGAPCRTLLLLSLHFEYIIFNNSAHTLVIIIVPLVCQDHEECAGFPLPGIREPPMKHFVSRFFRECTQFAHLRTTLAAVLLYLFGMHCEIRIESWAYIPMAIVVGPVRHPGRLTWPQTIWDGRWMRWMPVDTIYVVLCLCLAESKVNRTQIRFICLFYAQPLRDEYMFWLCIWPGQAIHMLFKLLSTTQSMWGTSKRLLFGWEECLECTHIWVYLMVVWDTWGDQQRWLWLRSVATFAFCCDRTLSYEVARWWHISVRLMRTMQHHGVAKTIWH